MICFQISIFEPLNTASDIKLPMMKALWFAFKLVSLSHWIQRKGGLNHGNRVVICFQISIFEPLNTASLHIHPSENQLWFAFKLVSLSHWIQHKVAAVMSEIVVICFQISIFEPLNTADATQPNAPKTLWFAFKLVSLSHWIQRNLCRHSNRQCCDLLSN